MVNDSDNTQPPFYYSLSCYCAHPTPDTVLSLQTYKITFDFSKLFFPYNSTVEVLFVEILTFKMSPKKGRKKAAASKECLRSRAENAKLKSREAEIKQEFLSAHNSIETLRGRQLSPSDLEFCGGTDLGLNNQPRPRSVSPFELPPPQYSPVPLSSAGRVLARPPVSPITPRPRKRLREVGTKRRRLSGKDCGIHASRLKLEPEHGALALNDFNCGSTEMPSLDAILRSSRKRVSLAQDYSNANGVAEARPSKRTKRTKTNKEQADRERALERNIGQVVFGDIAFRTQYPSWYPKDIIGEKALNGDLKGVGITVPTLYICKKCFAYTKVAERHVKHARKCGRNEPPGKKIYTHGGEGSPWSVWEVDGAVDTVYFIPSSISQIADPGTQVFCQCLSLFVKLWLETKSVLYDVAGFNYFLLVHTTPATFIAPASHQIIGFFSKEKMSWDNNNLACILIFPPWQRKGLGAILMGVSYEISRREGILGGPEKPISDLGKKGYKRFWGAEIARWILELKPSDLRKRKGKGVLTVEECSRDTWIHPEDVLGVLRDMDVIERARNGNGNIERVLCYKQKVREWVAKEGLDLARVVDPDGFVEGYGLKLATGACCADAEEE